MSNKHAACAVHSRQLWFLPLCPSHRFPLITGEFYTYCVLGFPVRTIFASHRFPLITGEFYTYCVLGFPVRTIFASTSLCHSEGVVIVQLPSSPHCSHSITVHYCLTLKLSPSHVTERTVSSLESKL